MTVNQQKRTARGNIDRYDNSTNYTLHHAYDRPSYAKERAWKYCLDLMEKFNGYGLKVISYNTFMFTAGFMFTDSKTGVLQFMFITPNYDVSVEY